MKRTNKSMLIQIISLSSALLLVFSLRTFDNNPYRFKTSAERDDSPSLSVSMYEIDPVLTTTKKYIPYSRKSFIESLGFTVHSELGGGGGGTGPKSGNQGENTDEIIPPPSISYYYYATPTRPAVLGDSPRLLTNDYDSLVFVVNNLERAAKAFFNNDKDYMANAVLGYIRSINNDYIRDEYGSYSSLVNVWNVVCGSFNSDFIEYVNDFDKYGEIGICDYFASFVPSNKISNYHTFDCCSACKDYNFRLIDPEDNISEIDLIHMFAAFDGIADNTDEEFSSGSYSYILSSLEAKYYKYLVSWAGDLQTAIKDISNRNLLSTINSFNDVMEMSGSYFPKEDFIADLDAFNMALNYDLKCPTMSYASVSGKLESYYSDIEDGTIDRVSLFRTKLASSVSDTGSEYARIHHVINELLMMDDSGLDLSNLLNSNNMFLNNKYGIMYKMLGTTTSISSYFPPSVNFYISSDFPSNTTRYIIANYFYFYLYN